MSWHYDTRLDRMIGHDHPIQYVDDELELGARAALAIQDPHQATWELEFNLRVRESLQRSLDRRG